MDWNWILFWQVASPILVGLAVPIFVYWWSHREKVLIEYPNVLPQLELEAKGIKFAYSFCLLYLRGTRERYVSEVWIELNKSVFKKLAPYFEIYLRMSEGFSIEKPRKLEVGKPEWFGSDHFFPVRTLASADELKKFDDLIQELWHKYKIGWRDTYGKTGRKTVNQLRYIEKSFRKAM